MSTGHSKTQSARTPAKKTTRPAAQGKGGKGRKPVKVVNSGINWNPIFTFGGAGLVALLIVGFAAFQVIKKDTAPSWEQQAAAISGIQDYRVSHPDWLTRNHVAGVQTYKTDPPVGGDHNGTWQNCMGNVYNAPIPKEQATHSLEHGAVWIAYQPNLPADQVAKLKSKVEGRSYMLMAPYTGLDKPISLQAWGYQLKVDNANDPRIDQFITALRQNATVEPGAACSNGITDTGDKPLNLNGTGM